MKRRLIRSLAQGSMLSAAVAFSAVLLCTCDDDNGSGSNVCTPDTYRCVSNDVQRCRTDGSDWEFYRTCEVGETCVDGMCGNTENCGNGNCDSGENCTVCLEDCGCEDDETCVDGTCGNTESCGNGNCDSGENCTVCLEDCGCEDDETCVDGTCIRETAESCVSFAEADLPMDDESEAVFDDLPIVFCATYSCEDTDIYCFGQQEVDVPEDLPPGQYLVVSYSEITSGGEGSTIASVSGIGEDEKSTLWGDDWPASVPAPSDVESQLVNLCAGGQTISFGVECILNGEVGPVVCRTVGLFYFFRSLSEEQCATDGLPGDECLWDHNCGSDLICTEGECASHQ